MRVEKGGGGGFGGSGFVSPPVVGAWAVRGRCGAVRCGAFKTWLAINEKNIKRFFVKKKCIV